MANGFGAVPQRLRQASGQIGTALGDARNLTWPQPSGDYGHAGVQSAWQNAIQALSTQVEGLGVAADGHAANLTAAAGGYQGADGTGADGLDAVARDLPGGGTVGHG